MQPILFQSDVDIILTFPLNFHLLFLSDRTGLVNYMLRQFSSIFLSSLTENVRTFCNCSQIYLGILQLHLYKNALAKSGLNRT